MNYAYSGKSTPEAIEDFRSHFISQLPKPLQWLIKIGVLRPRCVIVCDGCGRQEIIDGNATLLDTNRPDVKRWNGSLWTHQARLDFCELCSRNETSERAVADGAQPLGTYTL